MIALTPPLTSRVRLVGQVEHALLTAFYSAADFFVLGSHREGSGYAAIEALACGATPVVTDIPSFRTLTAEGTIGALWTPGDPRSFTGALDRVTAGARDDQRVQARALFERSFSWDAIGARAMQIYRSVKLSL
jgi:glycosyltransferase involved in cell wall biosynthesis